MLMKGNALYVLNDQGGGVMNVSYNVVGTLRAQDHGHPPLVFDARGNGGGVRYAQPSQEVTRPVFRTTQQ